MSGNDEAKVSVWILKLDFGIETHCQELLPSIHPDQDLLSGVFYFASMRGSTKYGSHDCKRMPALPLISRILQNFFFSRKVLFRLLQSWWDSDLVQKSLATSAWITFLHWEVFVSGSSVLCPETNESSQRKPHHQEVDVKPNKKWTGQAMSLGLIKMLLTTIM